MPPSSKAMLGGGSRKINKRVVEEHEVEHPDGRSRKVYIVWNVPRRRHLVKPSQEKAEAASKNVPAGTLIGENRPEASAVVVKAGIPEGGDQDQTQTEAASKNVHAGTPIGEKRPEAFTAVVVKAGIPEGGDQDHRCAYHRGGGGQDQTQTEAASKNVHAGTPIGEKRPEAFTADAMVVKASPGGAAGMDPTGTGAPSCEVPAGVGAAVLCIN
jgi:hypothetical protein